MSHDPSGLDCLGAELVGGRAFSWPASALALAAGALGAVVWRQHPVLGFLDGAAIASNVHAVATGRRTWREAAKRMGRHVVATAGSLALPAYPGVGYVAAAVAADLLLDGEGGGLLDQWTRFEGVAAREVVDVTPAPDPNTKALVKT